MSADRGTSLRLHPLTEYLPAYDYAYLRVKFVLYALYLQYQDIIRTA